MDERSFRARKLVLPLVVVYFTLLTGIMTWPLAQRMGTAMVGQIGDNIYFVWMIDWFKRALFDLHVSPFDIWFLNYPEGWNLAYTEITPAQLLLAVPVSLLAGPMAGYNFALLASFVLSGLTMFLWVRHLTGRVDAALVAGTIYAFLPYHFAHFLIGHLNLTGTQWLPLYFWGLFDLLAAQPDPQTGQVRFWRPALLGGIGLGLIGLTSQYYLYMALLVSACVVVCFLAFIDRKQIRSLAFWKRLAALGLAALPLVLVAVAPFALLSQQGGLPDRNISIARPYSASPTDFLLPSTDHFLWGSWVGAHFNRDMWVEGTLYVGVVTLGLVVLAWARRRQLGEKGLYLRLLLLGGLFALILAMGIDLHWLGEPVNIPAPAFIAERFQRSEIPVLLPGFFLFKYLPFFAKLRALMRFGVFVLLCLSAAAGLGAAWWLRRAGSLRRQAALCVLLLALVFVDFYPGAYRQFAQVAPRPVDAWLAAQPGQGAVILFPFVMGEDQEQIYYTSLYNKPFVGGFFNAFPPPQYARIRPVMEGFPDRASVDLTRQLGAQYVVVHVPSYPDAGQLRAQCEALGLRYVERLGEMMVFMFE